MARSHGIIKTQVWETGSEFRRLELAAQWAYAMLVSQPQINNCGVLPYVPERWIKLARNLTTATLGTALHELRQRRFVVIDQAAEELLVRTFIKHDRIWKQPNLVTAARREYRTIESDQIRRLLEHMHPWLLDDRAPSDVRDFEETRLPEPLPEPLFEGVPEGLPEPLSLEPLPEGVPEGVARARDAYAHAHPQPLPPPQPLPQGEDRFLSADRSETTRANGLPIDKELLTTQLITAIGSHADQGTATVVRSYTSRLPISAIAKVVESIRTSAPRNRAEYAVGALKHELDERPQTRAPHTEPEPVEQPPTRDVVVRQVAQLARNGHPWEAVSQLVEDLIAQVDPDEQRELRDLAADTYQQATTP